MFGQTELTPEEKVVRHYEMRERSFQRSFEPFAYNPNFDRRQAFELNVGRMTEMIANEIGWERQRFMEHAERRAANVIEATAFWQRQHQSLPAFGSARLLQDNLVTFLKALKNVMPSKAALKPFRFMEKAMKREGFLDTVTLDFTQRWSSPSKDRRLLDTITASYWTVTPEGTLAVVWFEGECPAMVNRAFTARVHFPTFYELAKLLPEEAMDFSRDGCGDLKINHFACRSTLKHEPITRDVAHWFVKGYVDAQHEAMARYQALHG